MLALRAALPCGRQSVAIMATLARQTTARHGKTANWEFPGIATTTNTTQVNVNVPLQLQQHRWYATQTDKDEAGLKRIYHGTLAPRMKMVKVLSLTTSLVGLAAQPMLLEQGVKIGGAGMAIFLCTVGGFFTFVTPVLLHLITKKYVTELHYNAATDEYTATTISLLLHKIQTKFRPSDVNVPDVPGMFTSFLVNKRPLFVDPALFDDPEHYVRIMGYDKPVDFKLDINAKPKNKTEEKQ